MIQCNCDWHEVRFRQYLIEKNTGRTVVKNVTGHSITRWKTQRKKKFLEQA